MPYVIPQMPLAVNIWRNGTPTTNPPDVVTTCNLTPGKRIFGSDSDTMILPGVTETTPPEWLPSMFALLPRGVDIRGWVDTGGTPDFAEIPAGTGRIYRVDFVDDIGKGFANEHRVAVLAQRGPWPHPIP